MFIQNRRFAQAPTQVLPLLGIWANASLDLLLRLFSSSFILYYLIVYLLSAYWLRNERAALLMPFSLVLIASRTFYWPQSELAQAMAILVLAHAGISRRTPLAFNFTTLVLALLIVTGIFGHPLAVFPFLFLWAYEWLLRRRWRDWGYYSLLAVGLLTYVFRSASVPAGSYEDVGSAFSTNLRMLFPHYLSLPSFGDFWHLCRTNFVAIPVILLVLTGYYLWQRSWPATLRLLLVWGAVSSYAFIVNVWRPEFGESTYMENLYLPLGILVGAPLAFELLPALEGSLGRRGPWLAAGVLALLLTGRLAAVYQVHDTYTGYQHWLQRVLAYTHQFPERRFFLDDVNADPTRLRAGWPWWSTPYETLLLSARQQPNSARSVYVCNDMPHFTELGKQPGLFVAPFEQLPLQELPARYFRMPDTQLAYRLLNSDPPADTLALGPYIASRRQAHIELVAIPETLKKDHQRTALVRISAPAAAMPLHSGLHTDHPTLVRSRFLGAGDWPTDVPSVEVPLEVDVWQPWLQDIPLSCPSKPGSYTLEISLFSKGYRDWPVQLRVPVEVK
ncbi:hypothetical protein [Hymenobacter baengnokdamensis]|uniref:hypothetical protein n=1 Tax=Hymenobacter baengnokdamensis TaxID=2615203 RepID=UPI001243C791|nr:hypothetical protein [Hymenobacter baengnokdamensis]